MLNKAPVMIHQETGEGSKGGVWKNVGETLVQMVYDPESQQ